MSGEPANRSAWLCLVGISGTILIRPVWSAEPTASTVEHYRSNGGYRDVFIVYADTLHRATRKARLHIRRRKSF